MAMTTPRIGEHVCCAYIYTLPLLVFSYNHLDAIICFFISFSCVRLRVCLLLWDKVDRRYHQQVDRLDAELNSYKTNLIKESIRIGYNELADLSYRR